MRESEVIAEVVARNPTLATAGGATVLVPPGDDMALVELRGRRVLVAADQVIEGRHWAPGTPLRLVARKALARNVSDIAAMAGVPSCAVATVALPPDMPDDEVRALAAGLHDAGLEFRCPLVGGDTGTHAGAGAPLVLSVSVLAEPGPSGRVVTRSGARPGDLLCVTGTLGASAGFGPGGHHLTFTPRIAEALALVDALGDRLHAMIDLSDGLAADAGHLASAAGCSALIEAGRLPVAPAIGWREAVGLGEDYELAFACDGPPPDAVCGTPVRVVGRFEAGRAGQVSVDADGMRHDVSGLGWEHGR
jgi:thiamine-monophosphate kinase